MTEGLLSPGSRAFIRYELNIQRKTSILIFCFLFQEDKRFIRSFRLAFAYPKALLGPPFGSL